ncbi:MAG: MIP/aquaporin family protein, partial [Hyphomicrobiales bacterium]
MGHAKRHLAEFLGTFMLVFFGEGAILQQHAAQNVGMTGIALAHGLGIMLGIYAFGAISGGHFNPCVTFGFLVTRRISFGGAVNYWIAQIVGACIAAWILAAAYHGGPADVHLGAPSLDPTIGTGMGAFLEGVMAFLLVIVIFGTAVDPRAPKGFAGLAIGLTITANILFGGGLTGGSFNPARAFGPSL